MAPTKKNVKQAKQALRASGITRASLAKGAGTTKAEEGKLFRNTAKRMATGRTTKSDTRNARKTLAGGPTAGVARTPASRAKAKAKTTAARQAYRKTR